jgi:hypothetical protein
MSDWKPYVVQANLAGMDLLVLDVTRTVAPRISTHPTPGTKGDRTQHHGRASMVDSGTILLTRPEVDRITKLAESPAVHTWTHPLLPQMEVRIDGLTIPTTVDTYGFFRCAFTFLEDWEDPKTSIDLGTISAASSKAKTTALYNDLLADLDGLDDIPGAQGAALATSTTALSAAMTGETGVFAAFDEIDDDSAAWRELSRSLDDWETAADSFVSAARDVASTVGEVAHELQRMPVLITETVRTAVDVAKAAAPVVATIQTLGVSDVFSMMTDAGIEITDDAVRRIMIENRLDDPLAIGPGLTIVLPGAP